MLSTSVVGEGMHKRLDIEAYHKQSLKLVDDRIIDEWSAERVDPVPEALRSSFVACWRIPVHFEDGPRCLLLLVDADFPFSLPRVALEDPPELLTWPHLERHGLLCVLPTLASGDYQQPWNQIRNIVGATCRLIESIVLGDPEEDFREEFLSYWLYATGESAPRCVSLVTPTGPSRKIAVWKGKERWYFADDQEALKSWLSGRFGRPADDFDPSSGWLLWRQAPWVPDEYPKKPSDVARLLRADLESFEGVGRILQDGSSLAVLVGAPTRHGACFGLVVHTFPRSTKPWRGGQASARLTKGFRPGRVPPHILFARAFGQGKDLSRRAVERADSAWIHGRDQDELHAVLRERHVAIVGAGSLGSLVATLLAQSGVGELMLVDPDILEWGNIGRHSLGAPSVGMNKAEAMGRSLQERFPHVRVDGRDSRIGLRSLDLVTELLATDLVVLATGSWTAEAIVNRVWVGEKDPPDLIVAWMEDYALASHAVRLTSHSGCLQCGITATGSPELVATSWVVNTVQQIPACGGLFMPYGPVELSAASTLVVELSLEALCDFRTGKNHWAWMGSTKRMQSIGGTWSKAWIAEIGDPGAGTKRVERVWPRDSRCLICG